MRRKRRDIGIIIVFVTGGLCGYLFAKSSQYRCSQKEEVLLTGLKVPGLFGQSKISSQHPTQYTGFSNSLDVFDSSADVKHSAQALTSRMTLASQKTEFNLGETILVTIQLFDSYNKRKSRGGDFVLVWMTEKSKNASSAGVITDHNNGSYTGTLKALWTGRPRIEASVAGSRETMQIYYRIFHDHYTLRNITALFESGDVREETLCRPVPQIPAFPLVCNLTADNYGLPWYCGKPSHRKLLCEDFTGLREPEGQPLLFTEHEKAFFDSTYLHQKLLHTVQVTVTSDEGYVPLPTTPCNKSPLKQSWEASTPVGFFFRNQWKSLTCKNTVPPDTETYQKCLKDRTLWIHGDSTSRKWFLVFYERLGLNFVTEIWDSTKWHKPAILHDEHWNITVKLVPHEYPFFHGHTFNKMAYNKATHVYLDQLPSDTRDIFVIHLYLHFNPLPPEVYRTHIRRIVRSVGSLISRAPWVKIAVRGPHSFISQRKTGFIDDIWMFVHDRILREEFEGYEDWVLFLNNVDVTVATENYNEHPNDLAVTSLLEHMMSYVCS